MKFELEHKEPLPDADPEELARVVLARFGLLPRKRDGLAKMHKLLLELYERKKISNREKKPESAVMTVEEMGLFAGIKRQTMYDHLGRWLALSVLKKTSFVSNGKVIIGYELNGPNMESAFKKAETAVKNHAEKSIELVKMLQGEIKREKLKSTLAQKEDKPVQKAKDLPEKQEQKEEDLEHIRMLFESLEKK